MSDLEIPAAVAAGAVAAPALPPDSLLVSAEDIPDKLYFRIGDVARLAGIKPYVLRFWETEFPSLGPKKSGTGHRLYRRKDVQLVFEIKTLLYEKRFTIEGARKFLELRAKTEQPAQTASRKGKAGAKKPAQPPVQARTQSGLFDIPSETLETVRKELTDILQLLK
ncbi:MAG: MerR family transcriptional regulator [Acidobacteriota bacterium]